MAALTFALLVPASASARTARHAELSFSAHGSAEQVYVTGLAPHASMSLLDAAGKTVSAQRADGLGGLVFRNVAPGTGYRVRLASDGAESGPITVHSDAAKPWDPGIYNQKIKGCGYQYLTTRDGTKLAIDVWTPTHPAGEPGVCTPPRRPFPP